MTHESMFGKAQWLGFDGNTRTPCVRADFDAPPNARGRILICGLGYFELYINGQRVSEDQFVPAVSDYVKRDIMANGQPFDEEMRHSCYVMEYDITPYLVPGKNKLGTAIGPGFFATEINHFGEDATYGEVRLCYRIILEDENGHVTEVVSGTDAKWKQSYVTWSNLFTGDGLDLRVCSDTWMMEDFENWQDVNILPPMDTDYLVQDCPADKIIRLITPRLVAEYPGSKVYDAGENLTGWVALKDASKCGEKIVVDFSEALDPCNVPDAKYQHWQRFEVVSDGKGRMVHPHFTWYGFRYFSLKGDAEVSHVAVIHADSPRASSFVSSHKTLNWLHDTFVHTMLCNMHGSIPSDCPHLERRGYTGDGQLTMEAALLTLNHHDFVRKWMRDIRDCQDKKTGHVQYTAPYTHCGGGPGGWGSAIVSVPYHYYKYYGETAPLADMYEGMCAYIGYLRAHSENHLVVSDRAGEWCLGDWCVPGGIKLPAPYVNNYFMIKSLDRIMEIEEILGIEKKTCWAECRKQAADAVMAHYFDPDTGDFAGGIQGANAFALDIGLGDERTFDNMVAYYEKLGFLDTGIFGTEIVPRVLFEKGAAGTAYKLLTSEHPVSFAGWMKAGATTLWEYWLGDIQRSLSHPMFGAVVSSLYTHVLGIAQEKGSAGWQKVRIEPKLLGQLASAQGHIETPNGKLSVSYVTQENRVKINIGIPPHVDAVLVAGDTETPLRAGEQTLYIPLA